jgi:hypothetical protein
MDYQNQQKKYQKKQDQLNEQLNKEAQAFIAKYGLLIMLDVSLGAINKLLIEKGVVTVAELRDAYSEAIKKAIAQEEKKRLKKLELDAKE